jgi:HSP20 family protein
LMSVKTLIVMRRLDRNDKDPFGKMQKMFEELQDMVPQQQSIPIDIRQEDDQIIVSADMPGVEKEDINIRADKETVEISAEASQEIREENEKYLRRERSSRTFRRTVRWPKEIDPETVSAEYNDGVLEITAELDEETGRRVEIE